MEPLTTPTELTEEEREERARKAKRAKVRIGIGAGLVVLSLGAWAYTRYGVAKAGLGGDCLYAMNCGKEAPTCLRVLDDKGACSRPCDVGTDCAPGVRCVKVELGEYDDRGVPLEGGYCIPQTLIDARKKARTDGGAETTTAKIDSVLRVPEGPSQLEAEVTLRTEKNGAPVGEPRAFAVKGTLLRVGGAASAGKKRTIVDADELRVFTVDDDKRSFVVTSLAGGARRDTDVTVTKTGRTDQVAGRTCEVWTLDEARAKREACVVLGGAFVDPAVHPAPSWARELAVRSAFPLRVVELDTTGKELSRLVAVHFDAHPIEASAFAVPHGYTNAAGR